MKFLSNVLLKAGLIVEGTTDLQGTATAVTQTLSDSSTKLATTAFVKGQGYAVGNIYTTDGSLSGNRTITLDGHYLDIAGATKTRFFANGNVVIDGASPVDAGFKLDVTGTTRLNGNTTVTGVLTGSDTIRSTNGTVTVSISYGSTAGIIGTTSNHSLEIRTNNVYRIGVNTAGVVNIANLIGTGSRMVVADAAGNLSTQAIPSVTGYVPYTGATTSLDLGTNSITAQNYLSDGNGSSIGGYFALKQYSTSNSGVPGYTSLYAVAQNSLYIRYSQTNGTQKNVELSSALLGTTTRQFVFPDNSGTFALTSDIPSLSGYVPTSRTLTINGTSYDLSADRSWTIATGVTGTGTTNYLPKFTGTSTIGNSLIQDDGTTVSITRTAGDLELSLWAGNTTTAGNSILGLYAGTGAGNLVPYGTIKVSPDAAGNTRAAKMVFGVRQSGGALLDALTINSSGNLGLGVTPSAWGSNVTALELPQSVSLYSWNASAVPQLYLGANHYWDGSTWRYKITGQASTLYYQAVGQHQWFNAPSGTAGNAISFTQAMTLNASGNLSIGNTNDTYKLDVSGSARFGGVASPRVYASGNGASGFPGYNLSNTTQEYEIVVRGNVSNAFQIRNATASTDLLSIASTGAATFSSSVTATSATITGSTDAFVNTNRSAVDYANGIRLQTAGSNNWLLGTAGNNNLIFYNYSLASSAIYINSSTNNVGIGTTSPDTKLQVAATGSTGLSVRTDSSGDAYMRLYRDSTIYAHWYADRTNSKVTFGAVENVPLTFDTNATERMRITSGGNVGIGTTNPAFLLDVNGVSGFRNDIYSYSSTYWFNGFTYFQITNSGNVGILKFTNNSSPISLQPNGGNVGIGTTSPSQKLEVAGIIRGEAVNVYGSTDPASTSPYLYSPSLGTLGFGANSSERMRINSIGNVGIKTTSPNATLDIGSGDIYVRTGSVTSNRFDTYNGGATQMFFGFPASGSVAFNNGSDRLYISNTGNVGIGTTSPDAGLTVETNSGVLNGISIRSTLAFSSSPDVAIAFRTKFNSAGNYSTNGIIVGYKDNATDGNQQGGLQFYTNAGSGIAEKMRITSGGRVGIGTTNPNSLLQVDGQITVNTTAPFSFTGGGNTATYTQTVVYANQNNTSGNTANGIFIERGRLSDSASAEIRSFVIGDRGGGIQFILNKDGDVGINTSSPSYKLDVNGTARFGAVIIGSLGTGTVYSNGGSLTNTNPSDYRLKNTIKPLTYGLNEVLQLNPKTFYYNDDATRARLKYGFIAQEVKEVMPDMVRLLGNEDYLGLESEGIWVTLVNAIKEQQAQINELKSQLNK